MKGLLYKEFCLLRKNLLFLLGMIVFFSAAFSIGGINTAVLIMWSMLVGMQAMNSFSLDEMANWNQTAMTMPLTRKQIVQEKFLLQGILTGMGALGTGIIALLFQAIFKTVSVQFLTEVLFLEWVSICSSLLFGSIALALLFWFSSEHARLFSLVLIVIPACSGSSVFAEGMPEWILMGKSAIAAALGILTVAALILEVVMYHISYAVFFRKDLA